MQEPDDSTLLREYAERNSEAAFAALVARHINKVYAVALRHTGNPHQAEEITQAVFVILAKKCGQLGKSVILSGWLYQTARLTAVTFIRGGIRRAHREQEAHMQMALNENESAAWAQIAPLLDAGMATLNETDRHAVVLRFFDGKSMREVGAAMGATEDATKKRVTRAVEKLRLFFLKRGVVSAAVVITAVISAHSAQAAPAALAKSVTAVALVKGATTTASTATLVKGALKVMAWTKAKTAIVVGMGVLLAAGTATVAVKEVEAHHTEAWQNQFDLFVTDRVPPQVKVLRSPSARSFEAHVAGEHNGKILGFGKDFPDVMLAAFGWHFNAGQLIFSAPIPAGQYDFISNLPDGQSEALQRAIKRKFGLVGRREMIETNVLILQVRSPHAAGLRPNSGGKVLFTDAPGSLVSHGQSLFGLVDYLRRTLGILVIDRTGIAGDYDIDLKWDSSEEGMRKALLDEAGLELVPGRESTEFLVVEKAN